LEKLKKELLHKSRYRGTKEMDFLIGKFVSSQINHMSAGNLNALKIFLDLPEWEAMDLIINNKKTSSFEDVGLQDLINSIHRFWESEAKQDAP